MKKSGGYRLAAGASLLAAGLVVILPIAVTASLEAVTGSTIALFIAAGVLALTGLVVLINGWIVRRAFDNRVVSYANATEHDGEPAPPPLHARRPGWADRPVNHMGDNQLGPRRNPRDRN